MTSQIFYITGTAHKEIGMKIATKTDWKTLDFPTEVRTFEYNREFSEEELNLLKYGHIPREQEDKWFMYMENNIIYFHRSWTGFGIYKIDLNNHIVTVNANKDQFNLPFEKNIELVSGILDMVIAMNKRELQEAI